jgi:hypothetical protein
MGRPAHNPFKGPAVAIRAFHFNPFVGTQKNLFKNISAGSAPEFKYRHTRAPQFNASTLSNPMV